MKNLLLRVRIVETFTSSFGRLRQKIGWKSVPHVQPDYFSSFNQSYHWFVASSFLKLPNSKIRDENTKRYIYISSNQSRLCNFAVDWKESAHSKSCSKQKNGQFSMHILFTRQKGKYCRFLLIITLTKQPPLKYLKWESLGSSSMDISYGQIR